MKITIILFVLTETTAKKTDKHFTMYFPKGILIACLHPPTQARILTEISVLLCTALKIDTRPKAYYRAVSNLVSKIILNSFGFALLRSVNGFNPRHLLNQSDAKPKPITTGSHAFSRAWRRLRVFVSRCHWSFVLFTFVVIGHCNCFDFGFGFTTLNGKAL